VAHPPQTKQKAFKLSDEGWGPTAICRELNIHYTTFYKWMRERKDGKYNYFEKRAMDALPNPRLRTELDDEPLRALDDFEYFRWRYLGRRSRPWQAEAAHSTVEWLRSEETEFIVVNLPPGAGKSTLFTNDIALWMIVRDRTIREFLGHRVKDEAEKYARRMKRALERTRPLPPDPSQGRMESAEGCLAVDYGRFQPRTGDVWRADEFTVLAEFAEEETAIEDKEATVTAKGMGTEFLGMRSELVVWDDLVTQRILSSVDQIENQRVWWDNEGVTRVEPGGCLMLVGQRMGPEDLYQHCLDERLPPDDEEPEFIENLTAEEYNEYLEIRGRTRYRHIIFPAHFEDRCNGKHGRGEEYAYPDGCLLDPVRLPWLGTNGLITIRANNEAKYRVQYQQENSSAADVLVPRAWIDGGRDSDGNMHPGCLDRFRGLAEVPKGLNAPVFSIASVDPSPTNYWAIQWWLYHPASEQRYLIDQIRKKMEAPDWLDYNELERTYYGIAHDWQARSKAMGYPITHWIFEQNAAQRFVLQQRLVRAWQSLHGVAVIAHNTTVRKLDEKFGVEMLRDRYKYGQVRLPYRTDELSFAAKRASDYLIREVTTYPHGATEDCLMAQYFFETNLQMIVANYRDPHEEEQTEWRPSWMRRRASA
jgi:hypothetical protein